MSASAQTDANRGVDGAIHSRTHDPGKSGSDPTIDAPDLIAGLWQEARFARLPDDAPPELDDFVQDIENPHRVYAVHRASRRHDFQLLVDRYIYQLRVGCDSPQCTSPTCFTCRKRLVGKAPIRRYSPTSARTLAVCLASQDHSDTGLCPHLRRSNDPPPASNNLIFSSSRSRPQYLPEPSSPKSTGPSGSRKISLSLEGESTHASSPRRCQVSIVDPHGPGANGNPHIRVDRESETRECNYAQRNCSDSETSMVNISEKPFSRDYRSFAATTFGTVAFKMLEWLTPQGLQAISKQYSDASTPDANPKQDVMKDSKAIDVEEFKSTVSKPPEILGRHSSSKSSQSGLTPELEQSRLPVPEPPRPDESILARDTVRRKRNSKSSVKNAAASKPQKKASIDPVTPANPTDGPRSTSKSNSFHGDKKPRTAKLTSGIISRTVPDIPKKSAFFENVPCISPPPVEEVDPLSFEQDVLEEDDSLTNSTTTIAKARNDKQNRENQQQSVPEADSSWVDYPLPQALSQLNVELVDFICDIFQEDCFNETGFFGPLTMSENHPNPLKGSRKLRRKHKQQEERASPSRSQWKAFNEQTIFNVMSNPQSLVKSFTRDGKLYDSQTLWYCMLRMTRAAPSLVLHSLWLAAKSLFVPPRSFRSGRLPSKKVFGDSPSLTNFEAGCIVSICLHALVAAAPCAEDSKTLHEMSRVRSGGSVLAARQPSSTCLEYDDVFSNELALRLARRIFCAITARKCFADIAVTDASIEDGANELDVLSILVDQLDPNGSGPVRILDFSQSERLLHETRMPTLLLDWARAVLLQEWSGQPEYSNNGPFHGAMSLISTLYENRSRLPHGDIQFRVDYFSERIDAMEVPIDWTAFTTTRQVHHILDHPYLFNPETLVTFFRAINFSRMSRTFEESASLKTRMAAIVDPGSLVTNTHHKHVLQDLLKTASSRFLVLAINRKHVLRDAFDQLWRRQERELLRPFKVHLGEGSGGEEGFDSGGVQQEFFRLAIAECLDPTYGAFTVDSRTRMAWFVPGSLVHEWQFEMIGLLMSLAVYNGLTLPITFPKAFYRKLLGQPVEKLDHISDGWPELASGLTTLQEWDEQNGTVEDIFSRTYEFSVSAFGGDVTIPMTKENSSWPQGVPAPPTRSSLAAATAEDNDAPLVTIENRCEYVTDYIRYLTDVSIRPQFRAFERGFRSCLDSKSLSLLTPSILQSIIEGVQEIDISELRRYTRYVGWDSSHHSIKDFWSIVKRYDDGMKRKLLEFITASDRVPVGGMKNMQFIIQKNGEEEGDGGHLPTAYTCYGTLLLPEYRDKEVLRERLGMALQNAQGFGFA
ncbi:hypothetical protein QQS21_010285 [Conoideocrella luteorostrata]|uniref:HECT-type E3 ubiquitin transferase n=1 Tax=Conoideocrella luteorostrata TaxID=1105319 RepID=A0AAJ0CFG2_9HYPO|nr:hypothetical protein QQS21_010285 [Conoideocrella luteorostrata]